MSAPDKIMPLPSGFVQIDSKTATYEGSHYDWNAKEECWIKRPQPHQYSREEIDRIIKEWEVRGACARCHEAMNLVAGTSELCRQGVNLPYWLLAMRDMAARINRQDEHIKRLEAAAPGSMGFD